MKLSQEWYSLNMRAKRPELLVGFRDSIKNWKKKFFFVKISELREWAERMR